MHAVLLAGRCGGRTQEARHVGTCFWTMTLAPPSVTLATTQQSEHHLAWTSQRRCLFVSRTAQHEKEVPADKRQGSARSAAWSRVQAGIQLRAIVAT